MPDREGELAEWLMAAVLKTVDLNGFGGSNPSLSARKWLTGICRPFFIFVTPNVAPNLKSLRGRECKWRRVKVGGISRPHPAHEE